MESCDNRRRTRPPFNFSTFKTYLLSVAETNAFDSTGSGEKSLRGVGRENGDISPVVEVNTYIYRFSDIRKREKTGVWG